MCASTTSKDPSQPSANSTVHSINIARRIERTATFKTSLAVDVAVPACDTPRRKRVHLANLPTMVKNCMCPPVQRASGRHAMHTILSVTCSDKFSVDMK